MSGPDVVVIGAGGFIGRCLVDRLRASRTRVVGVTRRPSATSGDVGGCDLSLPGWSHRLPVSADVLVWLAQSSRYRDEPDGNADMFAVNEAAWFEALEWARKRAVRRIIYASTGSVYRPADELLVEQSPIEPRSFYAATKLNGERLAERYGACAQVIVVRPFSVFGPNQASMLISRLAQRVATSAPIPINGDGPLLTPLYVNDAACALELLIRADLPGTDGGHSPLVLNLAGPAPVRLRQLVGQIGDVCSIEPVIEASVAPVTSLAGDSTKLRRMLPALKFTPLSQALGALRLRAE